MSKLLLSVLDNYNRQLSATLLQARQQWPSLYGVEDERLSEDELEKRREALLAAMTYLEQLQQLLTRFANQPGAVALRAAQRDGGNEVVG